MTNYVGSAVGGAVLGSLVALIVNRKEKNKNVVGHAIAGAGVALGLTVVTKVAPEPLKKPLLFAQGQGPLFVGAAPCGPTSYWDEASQSCIPLSLPQTPSVPTPACPPGSFYDYFRQTCVPTH